MVSQNFEIAMRQVKALSLDERQQLLAMLTNEVPPSPPATLEDQAEAALLAKGIISRAAAPATPADVARHRAIVPVIVNGKPVSETLIEDRR